MSNGVDGGAEENELDSHSSLHVEAGDALLQKNDEALDPDSEVTLNTNYDSSDCAVPIFRSKLLFFYLKVIFKLESILQENIFLGVNVVKIMKR